MDIVPGWSPARLASQRVCDWLTLHRTLSIGRHSIADAIGRPPVMTSVTPPIVTPWTAMITVALSALARSHDCVGALRSAKSQVLTASRTRRRYRDRRRYPWSATRGHGRVSGDDGTCPGRVSGNAAARGQRGKSPLPGVDFPLRKGGFFPLQRGFFEAKSGGFPGVFQPLPGGAAGARNPGNSGKIPDFRKSGKIGKKWENSKS